MIFNQSISQSFNQNLYIAPSRSLLRGAPNTSEREQSSKAGEIEKKHHSGAALDLSEARSRLFDKPQKKNGSALPQSGRMGPTNRHGLRTAVHDGLHEKREGGKAHANRRAPSQTSTTTPRMRSCVFLVLRLDLSTPAGLSMQLFVRFLNSLSLSS